MSTANNFSSADWTFFDKVATAAFANPFGTVRDALDHEIASAAAGAPARETIDGVVAAVGSRLGGITGAEIGRYSGKKAETLRLVVLFHLFHRYMADFDLLIRAQMESDTPCRVRFAPELLNDLASWGFSDADCRRYLAVFYQLRRAYYFIKTGLAGTSESMKILRKHLWDCVFTHDIRWFEARFWNRMEDFSVLLLGETGTGKGAAAAAIGRSGFIPYDTAKGTFSTSFTRNFLAINLSQFAEGVVESELFGHRKGAFTGAVENHDGIFSRCAAHGVIFLDEIGDVSVPVQIKLLQVLQERIFFPVGSHAGRRFSGRVVAATNRPLDELREEGKFRDDLYYRLCSDVITLPPLRRRLKEDPGELEVLVEHILSRLAGEISASEVELVSSALRREAGPGYEWRGNVRELEQAIKRLILTGHCTPSGKRGAAGDSRDFLKGIEEGTTDAETLLRNYCKLLYDRFRTYEEVSRRTKLDRRTVKKYVTSTA